MLDRLATPMWLFVTSLLIFQGCMASKSPDVLETLGDEVLKKHEGPEIDIKPEGK